MKRLILLPFIITLMGGLAAQGRELPGPGPSRIILRTGAVHHTGDPSGGIPYTSVAVSADFRLPAGTLGVTADLPGGERRTTAVELRYGYASTRGRWTIGGFFTGRYLRESDGFQQGLVGVLFSADWRFYGPFGAFVSAGVAYPLMHQAGHVFTPWAGQGMLSYGITLHF